MASPSRRRVAAAPAALSAPSSTFDLEVWTAPEEVPASLLAKVREAYVAYDAGRDERLSTMATAVREEAAIAAGLDDGSAGENGNGNGRGGSRGGSRRGAADAQRAKDTADKASASAAETYRQRWVALGDAAVAGLYRYGSGSRHALPPQAQAQLLAVVSDRALHGDGGALAGRAAALLSACLAAHPPAAFVPAAAARNGGAAAAEDDANDDANERPDAAHRGHAHVRINPVVWTPLHNGAGGGAGGGDDDDHDDSAAAARATRGAQQAREHAAAGRASGSSGFPLLFRRVEDALAATMAAKGGAAAVSALGLTAAELPASFSAAAASAGAGGGGGSSASASAAAPDAGASAVLLGHTIDVLQSDLAARLRAWSEANAEEAARSVGTDGGGDQEMADGDQEASAATAAAAAGGRRGGGRRGGAATTTGGGGSSAAAAGAFTPRRAAAARLLTNSLLWRLLRDELSWTADRAKGHLVRNLLMTLVLGSGELDGSLGGNGGNGDNGDNGNNNTDVALLASHASRLLRLIFELLSAAEASGLYSNAWAELPLAMRAGGGAAAASAAAIAAAAAQAGGADSAVAVAASAAASAARAAADEAAMLGPSSHGNDRAQLDRVLLDACVSGVQQLLPFRSLPSVRAAALRALPPLDRARLAAAAVAEAHQRSRVPADSLSAAEREKARANASKLALLDALHDYHSDRGRGAASYAGVAVAMTTAAAATAGAGGGGGVGGSVAASFGSVVDAALWRVASDGVWATRGLGGSDGVAVLLSALLAVGTGEQQQEAGAGGGEEDGDLTGARVKAAFEASAPTRVEVAADLAAAMRRAQAMMMAV